MKLRLLVLALVFATGLRGSLVRAQTANPIANPSFEQLDGKLGLPVGWSPWAQSNQCFYTLADAHSGVACAAITDDSDTLSQGLRSTRVPIEEGKRYQATVWVKIMALTAGGFALYLEFWDGFSRIQDTSSIVSQLGDWVQIKVTALAPPGATEATLLIYGSSASVGLAYFDDAALTLVP